MGKRIHLLDDIQIKHWMKQGTPIAKSDGDGLTFTLSGPGTATWVLRYSLPGGRRRELTLGNYPDVSLAKARQLAREERAAIDRGDDPASRKQIVKMESKMSWTVRALIADFKEKKLVPEEFADVTIYYRKWDLENVILPKLGSMRVDKVTPAHIVHVIESAERTWTVTKRILTTCTRLFAYACGKKLIYSNPAVGIDFTSLMGTRPPVRKRVMLSEEELCILLKDIEDIGIENALAFRILLATCVRSVELSKARWEHVDLVAGNWWVPDTVVKTRTGFLVPLTPTIVGWFKELKELAGGSEWVLPCRVERRRRRYGGDMHVGSTTLWAAIRRAFVRGDIEIRRFSPHDTRSTAKGHLRNMGFSREISEIALNHVIKGVEGIYDVREEIPERRVALERWANFIAHCEETANSAPAPWLLDGGQSEEEHPFLGEKWTESASATDAAPASA
ncbi:MAG: integrase arm-type DNA-binding domain-containing protein [Acidovorax sp.]